MTDPEMDKLDLFFDAAKATPVDPPADLMQRVLEDALALQPQPPAAAKDSAEDTGGWLSQLWAALGGWPAMAGLATAGVAGVWIGVNPPDVVSQSAAQYLNAGSDSYLVDMMPGFDLGLVEG